eukprot:1160990-Pelagomonas_calceolata.AAC.14
MPQFNQDSCLSTGNYIPTQANSPITTHHCQTGNILSPPTCAVDACAAGLAAAAAAAGDGGGDLSSCLSCCPSRPALRCRKGSPGLGRSQAGLLLP